MTVRAGTSDAMLRAIPSRRFTEPSRNSPDIISVTEKLPTWQTPEGASRALLEAAGLREEDLARHTSASRVRDGKRYVISTSPLDRRGNGDVSIRVEPLGLSGGVEQAVVVSTGPYRAGIRAFGARSETGTEAYQRLSILLNAWGAEGR